MALTWVTSPGSLANFLIDYASEINVIATNPLHPESPLTYSIISGELPPGMTLSTTDIGEPVTDPTNPYYGQIINHELVGKISGTPVYSTASNNLFTKLPYTFVVRATSDRGEKIDGTFTITISNTFNRDFYWVTPAGAIGTVPNGEFYSLPLKAVDVHNRAVTFSFLSGELPPGMQVIPRGMLQGVPTLLTAVQVNSSQNFRFTIRATNSNGNISDQAFDISVTNVFGPVIEPNKSYLGSYFDGQYFSQQLTVNELNPNVKIQWNVIQGQLPNGLTLDSTGLISGYLLPLELIGAWGPANYDSYSVDPKSGTVTDRAAYDRGPYQFTETNQNLSYNFIIEAFDGANYDIQEYTISILSRSGFTADSSLTVDNDNITVDSNNIYTPILLNSARTLPVARQDSYYAFKFDGIDFQGDTITYNLASTQGTYDSFITNVDEGFDYAPFDSFNSHGDQTSNLPGVILDSQSGWLYGKVTSQITNIETYSFGVYVSKTRDGVKYDSAPVYFNFSVLGDVNNVVKWITPANLGTIDNGSISELYLEAKSILNKPLVYTLYDHRGIPCHLPQGLELLPSGEISGRVSFEMFAVDDYTTTFDRNLMTFDRKYDVAVAATTSDGTSESVQQFTLTLKLADKNPYENLYLRAMPSLDQRKIYSSVLTDHEIFNPALIYRPTDPYYGVKHDIEMLFLSGLHPSAMNQYETAMLRNHYTKNYNFGAIKTAVVLDENYNVKYEVVYIDLEDPEENTNGFGPPIELDLTGRIINSPTGATVIYPNTSDNMISRLVAGVGYEDQSSLPPWMTSNQPDPVNPGKFKTPLGFIKAAVMAYTKPGAANLIAYRLKNSGINFNRIQFTVNKYQLDNYYSTNFDASTGTYVRMRETTFDSMAVNNIGQIIATVQYAVSIPFSEINGRPVDYINANGGIDGVTTWKDGDTIIFAKQENFNGDYLYSGWVDFTDAYIGDDISTNQVEGYDDTPYDRYYVVPGFGEKSQAISTVLVTATRSSSGDNYLTLSNAEGLVIGTEIIFTGDMFGGVEPGVSYYIASVVDNKRITLSPNSNLLTTLQLQDSAGTMPGKVIVNKRGGVWQIKIVENVVTLNFIKEIEVNQRIRVLQGNTYASAIMYYSINLSPGQSVPYYVPYYVKPKSKATRTTFNGNTTRFFNYRDQYYAPESQDKYVEFPQIGVFI
jgi:hypothetical protein